MAYTRINWVNYPDESTPINATNLNIMDKGISDLYTPTTANVTVQYGSSNETIHFTKIGRMVFSNYFEITAEITSVTWTTIGQLPINLYPLYNIQIFAQNIVTGVNPPKIRIATDGTISIAKYSSSGSQTWFFQIPVYMSNN